MDWVLVYIGLLAGRGKHQESPLGSQHQVYNLKNGVRKMACDRAHKGFFFSCFYLFIFLIGGMGRGKEERRPASGARSGRREERGRESERDKETKRREMATSTF